MHRCEPDQEFLLQFNKMGEAVKSAELASNAIGDTKMVNYYRGIWRGIQMAQEAYWTCWGITIQDQVEVNSATYYSGESSIPPTSSGEEDLP